MEAEAELREAFRELLLRLLQGRRHLAALIIGEIVSLGDVEGLDEHGSRISSVELEGLSGSQIEIEVVVSTKTVF